MNQGGVYVGLTGKVARWMGTWRNKSKGDSGNEWRGKHGILRRSWGAEKDGGILRRNWGTGRSGRILRSSWGAGWRNASSYDDHVEFGGGERKAEGRRKGT